VMSELVTDTALADAQEAAIEARRALEDAELRTLDRPMTLDDQMRELAVLSGRSKAAEVRLSRLTQLHQQQEQAAAQRAAAERGASKSLTAATERLTDARARLVDAATTAQQALADAVDAASAYDALVAEVDADLRAAGLAAVPGFDHQTAALGRPGVLIRGHRWARVDPGAVLLYCFRSVLSAVSGRRHLLARMPRTRELLELERSGLLPAQGR
jgi:hypothetical protein